MEVFLIVAAVWIALAVPAYFLLRREWLRCFDFSREDRAYILAFVIFCSPAALIIGIFGEIFSILRGEGEEILIHRKSRK